MSEQTSTAQAADAGHGHDHAAELKLYTRVFVSLLVLTALTVAAGYTTGIPESIGLVIAMAIAALKGTLVVLFFMHLKMETKNIVFIAGVPLVLAVILLIALSPDIAVG